MHGVFQRCAVKPYAAERLEVISRTYIFSLYFMIQRLELFLLQSARLNIAMSVSELILVLFQTSAAFLRYYFASVFLGYFRKSEAFFVVFVTSMQS